MEMNVHASAGAVVVAYLHTSLCSSLIAQSANTAVWISQNTNSLDIIAPHLMAKWRGL